MYLEKVKKEHQIAAEERFIIGGIIISRWLEGKR